jgi:hypothetical protein
MPTDQRFPAPPKQSLPLGLLLLKISRSIGSMKPALIFFVTRFFAAVSRSVPIDESQDFSVGVATVFTAKTFFTAGAFLTPETFFRAVFFASACSNAA